MYARDPEPLKEDQQDRRLNLDGNVRGERPGTLSFGGAPGAGGEGRGSLGPDRIDVGEIQPSLRTPPTRGAGAPGHTPTVAPTGRVRSLGIPGRGRQRDHPSPPAIKRVRGTRRRGEEGRARRAQRPGRGNGGENRAVKERRGGASVTVLACGGRTSGWFARGKEQARHSGQVSHGPWSENLLTMGTRKKGLRRVERQV